VIVVDQTGNRANKAVSQLKAAGFDDIYSLEGGIAAWTAAGLPLIK
jgi:rhodanese-related sulfurtransferase